MLLSKVSMTLGKKQHDEVQARLRLLVVAVMEVSVFTCIQLAVSPMWWARVAIPGSSMRWASLPGPAGNSPLPLLHYAAQHHRDRPGHREALQYRKCSCRAWSCIRR